MKAVDLYNGYYCAIPWQDCSRSGDNLVLCGEAQLEPAFCEMTASQMNISL